MERIRGSPVNENQKKILVEFMKQNPNLVKGTFSQKFSLVDARKLWEEISEILNSVPGGAKKEWRQWRKVIMVFYVLYYTNSFLLVLSHMPSHMPQIFYLHLYYLPNFQFFLKP